MEIAKSIYTHWGIDGDGLKDDNHRLAHEAIEIAEIFIKEWNATTKKPPIAHHMVKK